MPTPNYFQMHATQQKKSPIGYLQGVSNNLQHPHKNCECYQVVLDFRVYFNTLQYPYLSNKSFGHIFALSSQRLLLHLSHKFELMFDTLQHSIFIIYPFGIICPL